MKTSSVYLTNDVLRILTHAETTVGLTTAHGPIFFLTLMDGPLELGKKVLEAFDGFIPIIPHPKNQEEHRVEYQRYCERMKIKSWRTFAKNSKILDLKMDKKYKITIIPTKNLLAANIKGGNFSFLPEKTRLCSTDPEELGRAILAAFEDCE
ncbi:MAG: hypothetical protein ACRC4G_05590 [Alphaproteobacteria bacterium]